MCKFFLKISFLFILIIFLSLQTSISLKSEIQSIAQPLLKSQKLSKSLQISPDYGKIPLYFIPNKGQIHKNALYYANTSKYTLWVTKEGLSFDSTIKCDNQDRRDKAGLSALSDQHTRDVSRLIFLNANNNPEVIAVDKTEHKVNYFIGSDKSKWKTGIFTSKAVLYKELYKKIDLKVYGLEKEIEYDFFVKPGGKVSDIRFEYKDIKQTRIDKEGNLVVETMFGEFKHARPGCYQTIQGEKIEVDAWFKKIEENRYSFGVGKYDNTYELIIDPLVLVYSTFLGGDDTDGSYAITVDSQGAVYVSGYTYSTNFPTKKPIYGNYTRLRDAFVTKIDPEGQALIYSTYLGGSDHDLSYDIAVDSEGAAYVTGYTESKDFPTNKAFRKNNQGSTDAFITKIDPEGKKLVFSTYLGGSASDVGVGIDIDSEGAVYIVGGTYSSNFPTKNPIYGSYAGNKDVFITKINPKGKPLIYSTYLGGSKRDYSWDIAVDSEGCSYVTGSTQSTNFPIKKPFQRNFSGYLDAFITKINPNGKALSYSTYLGGHQYDSGHSIAVDSKGAAYVTGFTQSTDFPTKKAFRKYNQGGVDAFVTKINPKGKTLVYSTYLGGYNREESWGIAVDSKGAAYVAGFTTSTDFPTKNPIFENNAGSYDVFVTKIKPNGKPLVYSTYLGGDHQDRCWCLTIDSDGAVYVAGYTKSTNFPLKNPLQNKKRAHEDLFITKLKFE